MLWCGYRSGDRAHGVQ